MYAKGDVERRRRRSTLSFRGVDCAQIECAWKHFILISRGALSRARLFVIVVIVVIAIAIVFNALVVRLR